MQAGKETIYNTEFQQNLNAANQPDWLKKMREKAFRFFTENGFPTIENEEWKYTNVAPIGRENFHVGESANFTSETVVPFVFDESKESILVFTNGNFDKNLSNLNAIKDAGILSFSEALKNEKRAGILRAKLGSLVNSEKNAFTALNTAFIDEGVFIHLPKGVKIDAPVQLLFLTGEGKVSFPRVLIIAENFAEATIIETYNRAAETKYLTNSVVEISISDEAKIKHFRVQRESHSAFHVSNTAAEIGRGAVYDTTAINLGARISRHDVGLKFNAPGGEAFVDGLYFLGGEQHHDTHSVIAHDVPNCTSHQTYKGILNDKSRGVFNGKVFVAVGAHGTDGYQSNKNLLLSNEARVDTKPQLEIFNDDVKCSHGATVGQLEEEELFYLLSRGLNETLAKNLLTYGFAEEIVNKIEIESIKKQLDEAILNRLNASLEA
ncbi:MAG: Fe-S cluster assembly protein SufD [Pyrinomonadaceae bacterium]